MRFSEFFGLQKTQPYLDFVDIRLDTDIPVFVDPSAVRALTSSWGHECAALLQHYFEAVLEHIRAGRHREAQLLLSCLNERNEFHLGYSVSRSRGHAFGKESARSVWKALTESHAAATGLLRDLEDTALLIDGIGTDMISDAVCNILRGPLIKYTQDMCAYYGVPLTPDVASGPVWNPESGLWEHSFLELPVTNSGSVILVPKVFVRHQLSYRADQYYTHYLLPEMQTDEISRGSSLVYLLKDGTPRVTKKALREKYGNDKLAIARHTLPRPYVLEQYRQDKLRDIPPPLEHDVLAAIEETVPPDWADLLSQLRALPSGPDSATAYEDLIERILSALFYPALCKPHKQHQIHDGRKRIDITYLNESRSGFFHWLALHYPSAMVFVECKNYGKEVGNPELDQLSGRFSPSRGQVGILVCRSVSDAETLRLRCVDTAKDHRGYILVLTDDDINELVEYRRTEQTVHEYPLLNAKFQRLIA